MHRPDILFVICDDLAWGDLACHGNPLVRTPHLDRLHAEATRLTCYRSGPVCTPARASIMTGRYHLRTRAIDTYCGRALIDPGERTLAQVLAGAGYVTGCFGKWHLGDNWPMRPCDLGFEHSLWHCSGGIGQPGDHPDNHARGGGAYFDPVCYRGECEERTRGYCSDVFTDAALAFLQAEHDGRPRFAYLGFNAPHTPLEVDEAWAAPYRDRGCGDTLARLYGMVANIDHNVGRLLDALDASGRADDTLVVFTSDHGPCGSARLEDGSQRFNAGLRGHKGTLYEGGVRVPCLLRLPGRFATGRDLEVPANPIDWLPTLAGLAGAAVPEDRVIDGVDLGPLLAADGDPAAAPDRLLFMQWHRGDAPVRSRNAGVIAGTWKWYRPHEDAPDELYDLAADPGETTDLAAERSQRVADLRAAYDAWFDAVSTERADNYAVPPIPVGGDAPRQRLSRNDWRVLGADGWGDDERGQWWLDAGDAPKDLRVHLRWSDAADPERIHVRLEDDVHAARPGEDLTLRVTPGRHAIEAWGERGERRWAALYVELDGV